MRWPPDPPAPLVSGSASSRGTAGRAARLCHRGAHARRAPVPSAPPLGPVFLAVFLPVPVNGFPCFLCSSAPGYRGVLCRLSGIWDMSPLNGKTQGERGRTHHLREKSPRPRRLLLPCRWPGAVLEAPSFKCCVLPVWKMCQEAVAPLGRGWSTGGALSRALHRSTGVTVNGR